MTRQPPNSPLFPYPTLSRSPAPGPVDLCLTLGVADVLRTHAGVAPGTATAAVSAIIAGMFVGRVAGGRLVLRYPPAAVLIGALGVSAAGFALFWLASTPWLALVGLAVCGLGNAVHFPLGLALAVAHSGGQPELALSRTTYAICFALGVAPFALGAFADVVGPHTAILMVAGFLAVSATAVTRLLLSTAPVSAVLASAAPVSAVLASNP